MKKRLYQIIEIGKRDDIPSRLFDYFIVIAILVNIVCLLLSTFSELSAYYDLFQTIEYGLSVAFLIEYLLRLYTSDIQYNTSLYKGVFKFIFSWTGIVDLLAFLPTFLPVSFPAGIIAFRLMRVIRTFRLFQITPYTDAMSLIFDVIKSKKNQLLASVTFFGIMDIFASLVMYYLEHDVQPDVFKNAFSGIWWSVSTLLTIGYGDIYPITTAGRLVAIIVAFLGICIVAIPTGIISAGFIEQYRHSTAVSDSYSTSGMLRQTKKLLVTDKNFRKGLISLLKSYSED